jgi:mono/diheme cytochrome c family protein
VIDSLYKLIARTGFDEPLHPPITHMPIGLVMGALVFFVVALIFKRKQLVFSARHASILALVFAFPTILLGVFDWLHYYHGVLMPAIQIKMALAGILLLILGAGIILGGEVKLYKAWMVLIYGLSLVCVVGLGYYGGSIIYGRAIGSQAAVKGSSSTTSVDTSKGRAVFATNCQSCHANGGNAIDASLPLKGSKKLATLSDFTAFLRAPAMPDGSAGAMPPFAAADLSDADVGELHGYILSMQDVWK